MGSTFRELYSEYQIALRVYTEKLPTDEVTFMRSYTRGIQLFQRDTECLERKLTFQKASQEPYYTIPIDCLRIIQIKDVDASGRGRLCVPMGVKQRDAYNEKMSNGLYGDTKTLDYHRGYSYNNDSTRYSIHDNEIRFSRGEEPYEPDEILIFYKTDIPAFGTPLWTAGTNTPVFNYYTYWDAWWELNTQVPPVPTLDASFQRMFEVTRVNPLLAPYEHCFLMYAISEYIMSVGSPNFKEYERKYKEELEFAKAYLPEYSHHSTPEYNVSPWSW
jgi:hypothetical protein